MTSPRCDETQPLLNNCVRQAQTEIAVDEAQEEISQPMGQFRLFGSLLVDSIPGSYTLL